jgi:protocatechuate 3,4-dioxygenase beta subunit
MTRRSAGFLLLASALAAGWFGWKLLAGRSGALGPPPVAPPAVKPPPKAESRASTRAKTRIETSAAPVSSVGDRIEGVVSDESGRVLPDVDVQIIERHYLPKSTRPPDRRWEERLIKETMTDQAGRYAFEGLVPGELKTVRAGRPGFVQVFSDTVTVPSTYDIRLVAGAPVRGRIVDASTRVPIEGVGVKGWHASPGGPAYRWTEEVFTNTAGEYFFETAPAGTVTFMLAHPEYVDLMVDRTVEPTGNQVDFEIERGLVIEGVVTHAKGLGPGADLTVGAKDTNPVVARWTARTDKDGVFRMVGVRPGRVLFEISGKHVNPIKEVRELGVANDFSGSKPGARLEFEVQPAGRITGRVLGRDGQPVSGASIFVAAASGLFVVVRDPGERGGSVTAGETRTDADGRFVVDGITTAAHRVAAWAPGLALGTSDPMVVNPGELVETAPLRLNPAPAIHGIVTDGIGPPLAGAAVTVDIPQYPDVWFQPNFPIGQPEKRTIVTDEAGRYRIELPYGGRLAIRVEHPDFVLAEAEAEPKPGEPDVVRDFALTRALSISGKVTAEAGVSVAGAVVRAWSEEAKTPIEAPVAPSGEYRVAKIQAGLYRIVAAKPASSLFSEFRDEVPAGATGVDLKLVPLGEIVGNVVGPGGATITEFHVRAWPVGPRTPGRERRKSATAGLTRREQDVRDASGVFRIERVEAAAWWVQVLAAGCAPAVPVQVKVTGGGPTSAGTFLLQAGSVLRGRVQSPSGQAIAGVVVQAIRVRDLPDQDPLSVPPPAPTVPSSRTGLRGEYEILGLVAGEYGVKLESPTFVDVGQQPVVIPEGATVERSFTLRPAASVDLVVEDDSGAPVASAIVNVLDGEKQKLPMLVDGSAVGHTDASGRIALVKLPAGEPVTIRAVRLGFLVVESPQTLREGHNGTIRLRLDRLR